jgi:hypothetical protein
MYKKIKMIANGLLAMMVALLLVTCSSPPQTIVANGTTQETCHGADGRGGVHTMMGMQTMKSADIRWSALKSEFDAEKFRLALTKGQDPDGEKQLNRDMPRWNIGNEDLGDLITYLKTLS